MGTLPRATVARPSAGGNPSTGSALIAVFAAVATFADCTPRLYGNAAAAVAKHSYCEGIEYAANHLARTGLPFLLVPLPIATPGVVSREDTSGNTGTSVTSVTAGSSGVLAEHDGAVRATKNQTVGTDQVVIEYTLDGGRTWKPLRLGTATSIALPYSGVIFAATAGTIKAGETLHTWHGSAPLPDADGLNAARLKLAAGQRFFRTAILIGDCPDATLAAAWGTMLDAYDATDRRPVIGRASVRDRLPLAAMSLGEVGMSGAPTLTFAEVGESGDTITRSAGSWISDGFVVGDTVVITGTASNNGSFVIASLSATVITLGSAGDLVDEGPVSGCTVRGYPTLTFSDSADTIVRSRGSWLMDGFRIGSLVSITGTASNDLEDDEVTTVSASTLSFASGTCADEVIGAAGLAVGAGETATDWVNALDVAFASITGKPQVNLSLGRGRATSVLSGWYRRVPSGWGASWREYQHAQHVATWRRSDGAIGLDLFDAEGTKVEYDDRDNGGAAVGARFTCLMTDPEEPSGAYIAQDLTRETDGSPLTIHAYQSVINFFRLQCQLATRQVFVGREMILTEEGNATPDELSTAQGEVMGRLQAVNTSREGPLCSEVMWAPALDDDLTVAEPVIHGVLSVRFKGIVHSVETATEIASSGG